MAEQLERITVTLSHDEWQWVLSLVMNSAYIRAKPIVEATEAAVRNAREVREAAALQEQGDRDDLRRQAEQARWHLRDYESEMDNLRRENARMARQVDGYKGKLSQMRKQKPTANGHDYVSELQELRRALEESRRTNGLLLERIRTGQWPGGVEITEAIEVEAERTDPLEQADDHG